MHDRSFSPARLTLAFALAAALSGPAWAADDAARIGELERRLEVLQQQVSEVAAGHHGSSADVALHGFADIGAMSSSADNSVDAGRKGFTVGSLAFYLTPQFGDRVKTLLELVFEIDHDGSMVTDLERVQIGYTFSDGLTAWGGRFHTPYGYWNTAFHHGEQIQTSVMRPRFLDFEDKGGILPAHAVGAWFTGAQPLGGSKLGYDFYVVNSPTIAADDPTAPVSPVTGDAVGSLDMNMAGSEGSYTPAVGFNLSLRPGALSDLVFGVHAYRGKVGDTNASPNRTRLAMAGGYAVFDNDVWELLSEYYRFSNRDLSGTSGTHASSAWYAQAAYRTGDLTPYVRLEKTQLAQADHYFAAQAFGRSYRRAAVGASYDVNPKAVLKFEVDRTRQADLGLGIPDDDYREARIRLAVRF